MGMVVVAFLAANAAGVSGDHDQINLKTNQVRRKLRQALMLLLCKPVLDVDIFSFQMEPSWRSPWRSASSADRDFRRKEWVEKTDEEPSLTTAAPRR